MAIGSGCAHSRGNALTAPHADYRAALAAANVSAAAATAEAERAALARVTAMFADFSVSNVTAYVREVYAADAYLRDGFKELRGLDAIAPYMIRSAEPLRHCAFVFEDIAVHDGNYYLRWIMTTNLRRDPPARVSQVIGMSHIRFNAAGRVVFQQDYWDPSDVLYSRIPIAGWMINRVKAGL